METHKEHYIFLIYPESFHPNVHLKTHGGYYIYYVRLVTCLHLLQHLNIFHIIILLHYIFFYYTRLGFLLLFLQLVMVHFQELVSFN